MTVHRIPWWMYERMVGDGDVRDPYAAFPDHRYMGEPVRNTSYVFDQDGEFAEIETSPDETMNMIFDGSAASENAIGIRETAFNAAALGNLETALNSSGPVRFLAQIGEAIDRAREDQNRRATFVPGDVSITVSFVTEAGSTDAVFGPPCDYCQGPTMRPWLREVPESRWLCLNCQDLCQED